MLKLILFLTIYFVVFLLLILGMFSDDIKSYSEKKNHKKHVYKVLDDFVEENDQLLLNDVVCCFEKDQEPTLIDHILFCDKYVYVIKDFYERGGVFGNLADPHLFCQTRDGKKKKIENPVLENREIIHKLELYTAIPQSEKLFVSVVVFNNSLVVPKGVAVKEQGNWFLPLKDLVGTIKVAEQDDVNPMSEEMSQRLCDMLQKYSEKAKKDYQVSKVGR